MKWGGAEWEWDPFDGAFTIEEDYPADVIHFDLKPGNVFLANRNEYHPETPIATIGDFGLALYGSWANAISSKSKPAYYLQHPKRGTPGWYSPEQFTRRFDLIGWENDPEVGNYSHKTNIWRMGLIMWQLATLSRGTPRPSEAFLPKFSILGSVGEGVCYGTNIMAVKNISDRLKETILACLYEDPCLRPELLKFKELIREGISTCIAEKVPIDPWDSFLPYEPPVGPAAPPPPPPPPADNAAPKDKTDQKDDLVELAAQLAQPAQPVPAIIPRPPAPPAKSPFLPARSRGTVNSFGTNKNVNTTCHYRYAAPRIDGQICGKPYGATKKEILEGKARCRTHPLERFPDAKLQRSY